MWFGAGVSLFDHMKVWREVNSFMVASTTTAYFSDRASVMISFVQVICWLWISVDLGLKQCFLNSLCLEMSEGRTSGKAEEIQIPAHCRHDATSLDIKGGSFCSSDQRGWQSPLRLKWRHLLTCPHFPLLFPFCPSFPLFSFFSPFPFSYASYLNISTLCRTIVLQICGLDVWSDTSYSDTWYATRNT